MLLTGKKDWFLPTLSPANLFIYFYSFLLFLSCRLLSIPFGEMQSDDIKLYYDQTDSWKLFPVSDDTEIRYGWKNSRFLKATSQGLGKLTATLSYFSQYNKMKEVGPYINFVLLSVLFFLHFYHLAVLCSIFALFYYFFREWYLIPFGECLVRSFIPPA